MRFFNRREIFLTLLLLTVTLTFFPFPLQAEPLTDSRIHQGVEDELWTEPDLPVNRLDLYVVDGVVNLVGTVSSLLSKERAALIAETVRGVRAVVNRIEVEPAVPVEDSEIEKEIEEAMADRVWLDKGRIGVQVLGGRVMLNGAVPSATYRNMVGKIAASVRGVRAVQNDLQIAVSESPPGDAELTRALESRLRWDALVDAEEVTVQVREGRATLRGQVGSAAEKRRAIELAGIKGVKDVSAAELEVVPADKGQGRIAASKPDESNVRDALLSALIYDPRTNRFDIEVEVSGQTVTLRGTVDNLEAGYAAEQDARNTAGVARVKNRLRVRPESTLPDDAILQRIRKALARDPYLERENIAVEVIDGTVWLTGPVDSRYEKIRAGYVTSTVPGVREVRNNLKAYDESAPPPGLDPYVEEYFTPEILLFEYRPMMTLKEDRRIAEDIREQLFWSPFVDAGDIQVQVEEGVAILSGTVDDAWEAQAAVENAFDGGAVHVRNKMTIRETE